jgi:hypothetical protein
LPEDFQSRVSGVTLPDFRIPIAPLDATITRWIEEQKDHSKKAKDLRSILSAEAFRFFIARNMGVNSGQQDKNISVEHQFWQDVSDTVRNLSAEHSSPPPQKTFRSMASHRP